MTLFKMGLANDNTCAFCRADSESIEHLFWHCNCVESFIKSLKQWLQGLTKSIFEFLMTDFIQSLEDVN